MKLLKKYPALLTTLAILLLWALAANREWLGRSLLASPWEVTQRLWLALQPDEPRSASIFLHAIETARRAMVGWLLGVGIGLLFGLMIGAKRSAYLASEPLMEFVRAVPPLLAFPLLLVAFSFNEQAYIWTIVYGCLPVMILSVARGFQSIDPARMEILQIHEVSKGVRIFASLMEIIPAAFLGARVSFSISLVIAVVSEMVFTPRSGFALGSMAKDSEITFDTATFYACIIVVGVFGYVGNVLMRRIEQYLQGDGGHGEIQGES